MKILLDTCTFIWLITDSEKLSEKAKNIFMNTDNVILLSAVSSWEIAIKYALKKVKILKNPAQFIPEQMEKNRIEALPIQHSHCLKVANLLHHHRDPFDRLLIAQADIEHLFILTPDQQFKPYKVKTIW